MSDRTPGESLDRGLVTVMAVATGLAVANNYFAQPLLPAIGHGFHVSSTVAGLIVTVAQAGYAAGLVLLLPLGDLVERRLLVVILSVSTAAALIWFGASPSIGSLLPAAFAVGGVSVLAQVLVPFSASLASPHERGRVVGLVMSGLLIGILLARTVAGFLAESGTWRAVYFAAAGAMVVQACVLRWRLPRWKEDTGLRYGALLHSVWLLLREEPVLRLRSAFGFVSFGTFSVLWTSLAFLLAHRFHYSTGAIGLFGLAGAAGAVSATLAGRLSDRRHSRVTTGIAGLLLLVSWPVLWYGSRSVAVLVVGIVLLDIGSQGLHITNQGEIYRLRSEARSRLTAAYMVCFFAGGAAGSAISATAYSRAGWGGVCVTGLCFAAVGVVLWIATLAGPFAHLALSSETPEVTGPEWS